jgi:hypothetical protein
MLYYSINNLGLHCNEVHAATDPRLTGVMRLMRQMPRRRGTFVGLARDA